MRDKKRLQLLRFDGGRWFMFPLSFLTFLKGDVAILLAELVNLYCLRLRAGEVDELGWTRFSTPALQSRLPFHEEKIKRGLRALRQLGLVKTKTAGMPAKRYVRLSASRISALVDEGESQLPGRSELTEQGRSSLTQHAGSSLTQLDSQNSQESTGVSHQKPRNKKPLKNLSEESSSERRGIRVLKGGKDSPWERMSTDLYTAIEKVRKVPAASKPKGWVHGFRLLHERDGIPTKRIRRVLDWYIGVLREGDLIRSNPDYIPIGYTGQKFREKFDRIEAAMHRLRQKEEKVEDRNYADPMIQQETPEEARRRRLQEKKRQKMTSQISSKTIGF